MGKIQKNGDNGKWEGDDIIEREMIMLPRNEKRHRYTINVFLKLLEENKIVIPDKELIAYLEEDFFGSETKEKKDMMVYMKNQDMHRSVISFLKDLLDEKHIFIQNETLKSYLKNVVRHDCMVEDIFNLE